jgi:lysophospholipid acyltransferase (LPLAT)-like uncharacterized protein
MWRVDAVPWPFGPLVRLYGWLAAALLGLLWGVLKLTVRVEHVGRPAGFEDGPHIACAWHEALLPYFVAAMPYPRPHVWMNHPLWYMRGIHVFLGWMRVRKLVLGSSGHGGMAALAALAPEVRKGLPTFLNPDGPHGPARQVKDGVLLLSESTGAPVVALRIECSSALRLPSWDRKLVPLPLSRVTVTYGAPLVVTPASREACREAIARHLEGGRGGVRDAGPAR